MRQEVRSQVWGSGGGPNAQPVGAGAPLWPIFCHLGGDVGHRNSTSSHVPRQPQRGMALSPLLPEDTERPRQCVLKWPGRAVGWGPNKQRNVPGPGSLEEGLMRDHREAGLGVGAFAFAGRIKLGVLG